MSALPPKADIGTGPRNVCFVPKVDIHHSFDHMVGAGLDRDVLAFNESCIVEPVLEAIDVLREIVRRGRVKKTRSR